MSVQDHIRDLEEKIKGQAERIKDFQRVEDFRKRQLDALHYVWCSGGCPRGIHRFGDHPPLTRQMVVDAARCVARMAESINSTEFKAIYKDRPGQLSYDEVKAIFDDDAEHAEIRTIADALYALAKHLSGPKA